MKAGRFFDTMNCCINLPHVFLIFASSHFTNFAIAAQINSETPNFRWSDTEVNPKSGIPLLHIAFDNDGEDVAFLEPFAMEHVHVSGGKAIDPKDYCALCGYLRDERSVFVSLSGCPGSSNFEIQMKSTRLKNWAFRTVDGMTRTLLNPEDFRNKTIPLDMALKVPEEILEKDRLDLEQKSRSSIKDPLAALNPRGYVLPVRVGLVGNWINQFGSGSAGIAKANSVLVHAQNAFNWKTSLTTTVFLDIRDYREYPTTFIDASEAGLNVVGLFNDDFGVNAFVYLTYQGGQGGVIGIAWVSTLCSSSIFFRTSISEYFDSDTYTGHLIAHEIGHNSGMLHDFVNNDRNQPKYDQNGNSCTGIGGVMDYRSPRTRWSTCSVAEMDAYISPRPWCLQLQEIEPVDLFCKTVRRYGNYAECYENRIQDVWRATSCICGDGSGSWSLEFDSCWCHGKNATYIQPWTEVVCCRDNSNGVTQPVLECTQQGRRGNYANCDKNDGSLPIGASCGNHCGSWKTNFIGAFCLQSQCNVPSINYVATTCCNTLDPNYVLECDFSIRYGYVRAKCSEGYTPVACSCSQGCGKHHHNHLGCKCDESCAPKTRLWSGVTCCRIVPASN